MIFITITAAGIPETTYKKFACKSSRKINVKYCTYLRLKMFRSSKYKARIHCYLK